MTRIPLIPKKGFGLLFCLLTAAVLSGCISLDCKGCTKCDGTAGTDACGWRAPTAADTTTFKCTKGRVCTGYGTCGGTCTTTVSLDQTTCACSCM